MSDPEAVQSYVFLSYASAEREQALTIADRLASAGIRVWVDRQAIAGGTSWSTEIAAGIEHCSAFLLLCSEAAFASRNVRQEIQLAWKYRRPYIPLVLQAGPIPRDVEYFLEGWQWVDVLDLPESDWLPRLIRALQRLGLQGERATEPAGTGRPAPPEPAPAALTNLPVPASSFVGRRQELDAIQRLLQGNRLVTQAGPGGSGKTRLAIETGRDLRGRFADGVWLVELAAIQQPDLVPQAVAAALGVREVAGKPLVDSLIDFLRSRQILLILDNCEHLIGACAGLAARLLPACPALTLLTTSREVLSVDGEAVYRVPPLSLPEGDAVTAAAVARSEAVQLFLARAAAARPGFAITDENAAAVGALVRRLDGIPLALELAAARMKVLSVEQIAAHLADRFRLLTGGSRTAPARQQTLRAAIDWSYQLLDEAEQALFARLSVFAGGLDCDAAAAVCATDGTGGIDVYALLDLLTELVDKSLVLAGEDAGGRLRYRLLESIRQYGEEQLTTRGEAEDTHRRHRAYYLALAEEGAPALLGPEQAVWLDRLDREHDNCRAALSWSAERGEAVPALRLAAALSRFWERRGYLSEGRAWLERLLAQADTVPDTLKAEGIEYAGRLARLQGDYAGARQLLERSLALYRERGEPHSIAAVLGYLGVVAMRQGDFDRAQPLHEESLALLRDLGDKRGFAAALLNLSNVARRRGDAGRAVSLRKESLELYRAVGDRQGMALALLNLGVSAADAGEFGQAVALLEQSLTLARELGDWFGITRPLYDLVTPLLQLGDTERARAAGREALTICQAHADQDGIAYCLEAMAGVAATLAEMERAARLLGAASALRERMGAPRAAVDRAAVERVTTAAQAALGGEGFAAALAAGRGADLAAVVRSALAVGEAAGKEHGLVSA